MLWCSLYTTWGAGRSNKLSYPIVHPASYKKILAWPDRPLVQYWWKHGTRRSLLWDLKHISQDWMQTWYFHWLALGPNWDPNTSFYWMYVSLNFQLGSFLYLYISASFNLLQRSCLFWSRQLFQSETMNWSLLTE